MILVKGVKVGFATVDGKEIFLPAKSGMIHDPDGKDLPRCEVLFGPYRRMPAKAKLTRHAERYFGRDYQGTIVKINRPAGEWYHVADVVKIFYVRAGKNAGGYHHTFRGAPLTLSKSGFFYRLSLGHGCIVDDRGYVFP